MLPNASCSARSVAAMPSYTGCCWTISPPGTWSLRVVTHGLPSRPRSKSNCKPHDRVLASGTAWHGDSIRARPMAENPHPGSGVSGPRLRSGTLECAWPGDKTGAVRPGRVAAEGPRPFRVPRAPGPGRGRGPRLDGCTALTRSSEWSAGAPMEGVSSVFLSPSLG
jgi:hypothetical protein